MRGTVMAAAIEVVGAALVAIALITVMTDGSREPALASTVGERTRRCRPASLMRARSTMRRGSWTRSGLLGPSRPPTSPCRSGAARRSSSRASAASPCW